MPPHIEVWRSVRSHGDTKTKRSRRTLALPSQAVAVFKTHKAEQAKDRLAAGALRQETILVFCTKVGHSGTAVTETVYRKEFRPVLTDGAEVIGSIFTRKSAD